jgi:hypothetical protein
MIKKKEKGLKKSKKNSVYIGEKKEAKNVMYDHIFETTHHAS